mmetsp:Transcript_24936/g.36864  ORF Transcript_24936/g.36864 Transcript_24936/m.36864 type:complete len:271 (-) Transcript_24936:110-922(-)
MTTIRYFIPEDGDNELHPNVFLAPRPRNSGEPPTLGQVKNSFPLPGRYHFRFKSPLVPGGDRDKHAAAVWMDCVDERQPCPIWKNGIIVKATRIGVEDEDDDDDSDFGAREHPISSSAPPSAAPVPAPRPAAAEPVLDIFDGPAPAAHSAPHSAPTSNNLLDVPPAGPQSHSSLLDMHAPSGDSYSANATSSANDFLGMTAHPTSTPATPSPQATQGQSYGGATPGYPQHQQQQQPQQQQRPPQAPRSGPNAFDSFGNQQGPFGGLQWNN